MLTKREACWGALGLVGTTYAVAAVCWLLAQLTLAVFDLDAPESVIEAASPLQNFITEM